MPLFLIVSDKNNPVLEKNIKSEFPEDHYIVAGNHWLVAADKTTRELADLFDIRVGGKGPAVVFKITAYSGRHRAGLWEWLALKTESEK